MIEVKNYSAANKLFSFIQASVDGEIWYAWEEALTMVLTMYQGFVNYLRFKLWSLIGSSMLSCYLKQNISKPNAVENERSWHSKSQNSNCWKFYMCLIASWKAEKYLAQLNYKDVSFRKQFPFKQKYKH